MLKLKLLFVFLIICTCTVSFTQIVINEIASRGNVQSINGDGSDWIEIYNAGITEVNLNGYGLSDNAIHLHQWIFPDVILPPASSLLVLASGENNLQLIHHWETAIAYDNFWQYFIGTSAPPADWNTITFDDGLWSSGQGSIGNGDGDDNTYISSTVSLFMRKKFTVTDISALNAAVLHADYDDAFVAYLNGVEIARSSNITGAPPAYNTGATIDHEAVIYSGGVPETFSINYDVLEAALLPGDNVLSIQVHNTNIYSSDMSSLFWLSFGIENSIEFYEPTPYFFNLSPVFLETSFKISTEGETIYLSDASANILDQKFSGYMDADHSIGRVPDASTAWCIISEPTPGLSNNLSECIGGYEPAPVFSLTPGFYSGSQTIEITSPSASSVIRYTLDGSQVNNTSPVYSLPVTIDTSSVVSAKCFSSGTLLPGPMIKNTYLLDEGDFGINVISISTDKGSLWDIDSGIYVLGTTYDPWYPYFGANFWEEWERAAHISYFDTDGNILFAKQMMLEIHGGWSRAESKKSFRIDFKNALDGGVEFPLFPDKPEVTSFNNFNLRSGGQHVWTSMIQDAFLARNMRTTYIDYEAYTPCHVFLNGVYWGIYEIREKADEHFAESNYGIDADDVDLMNGWTTLAGTDTGFVNLYNWIMTHDPDADAFYNYFADRVDVQNYVDYYIGEIYYQNIDFGGAYWGQNNIKFYREKNGGKWRHIMYDLDGAMGWFGGSVYDNFIDLIRNPASPSMNSYIFDRMLDNETFRIYFINRFADLINTIYQQEHMEAEMEELTNALVDEMGRQIDRWGAPYSVINWLNYTEGILNYNNTRISPARYQIKESFDLNQQRFITLDVQPPGAGYIQVSTIIPQEHPWEGVYFEDVPLQFTAIPNPGYTFSHWTPVDVIPDAEEINQSVTVFLNSSDLFEANFTGAAVEVDIIVSEFNYNSENTANSGDWFEIYNNGSDAVDISGWQLSDATGTNIFHIPVQTILEADAYLVIASDVAQFKNIHPDVINVMGDFNFKLDNDADTILFTALNGDAIFSVAYADNAGWPHGADGTGRTLELINYDGDLSDALNWFDGCMFGSPGTAYTPCNEQFVFSEINYNSADTADAGDWVEILNTSAATVDMSLWKFADRNDTIVFQFPVGTLLSGGERIVIANNTALFNERHADVTPLATNFYFGLDGAGEELRLFDADGIIRFSVIYNDAASWPIEADGGGKTLELANVHGVMNDASNWFAGCPEGSPAAAYDPTCGVVTYVGEHNISVLVYPNPADDYFIVHVNGLTMDDCWIALLDITGTEIFSERIKSNTDKTFYRKNLPAGLYFLKLQFDGNEIIRKIIFQ